MTEGVVSGIRTEKNRKEEKVKRRYIIPEDYLKVEEDTITRLTEKVANTGKDQERIDEVYGEVMLLMKKGLKEEKWTATKDTLHNFFFTCTYLIIQIFYKNVLCICDMRKRDCTKCKNIMCTLKLRKNDYKEDIKKT